MRFVALVLAALLLVPGQTAAARPPSAVFLNVVAHQDDDLLFLTPDLSQTLKASVTVYVTAGEGSHPESMTPEDYAEMRQAGERNAYATMAGVANRWDRVALRTGTGTTAELATLRARPSIKLVFLRLHDWSDLHGLWTGEVAAGGTVRPTWSPAQAEDVYTRDKLTKTLTWLMDRFRPTVIRTQNPAPLSGFYAPDPDNPDHTAVARFTNLAAESYRGKAQVRNYRGYDDAQLPTGLDPALRAERTKAFRAYADVDTNVATLFDDPASYLGWRQTMLNRWPSGVSWTDGSGEAYAVLGDEVKRWRRNARGEWGKPVGLGGGGFAPAVTLARQADGRLRLFSLNRNTFDVVTAVQEGDGYSAWTSLGNPNGPGGTQTGLPAAAADAQGRLWFFVRNGGGGVSARQQNADGTFGDWQDMHGWGVQDGLSVVSVDGRLQVFATQCSARLYVTATCSIARLAQGSDGFEWDSAVVPGAAATAPTAVAGTDGKAHVYFRATETAAVLMAVDGMVTDLGNPGGPGEVAATATGEVYARNAAHGISARDASGWHPVGGYTESSPAVVEGGVVALGVDGRLTQVVG
ncbi:GlcNAc-PI de-N-acetylase [Amycolatopsis xylanica]|uniref:GlcNAc-PI de-N-acetylase n=1 Tax=Amycolatopsis xylanica TaxID=589385 RepID=A0A1H3HA52_9PSEU|nr:PIG-L family deacetylase [Amycolatopsis xylanica]SDY12297.1 GlcNAc-PI de-N-acetylase [Amycolatopsis xylanica]